MRKAYLSLFLSALFLFSDLIVFSQTRDPWLWPFEKTSIWNMPIGSNARYVDIDLVPTRGIGIDVKHFLELDVQYPSREIIGFDRFAPSNGRCSGTTPMNGLRVNIPNDWIVYDVFSGSPYGNKPNASFVFLNTDKETTWNGPSIARCQRGGPLYMRSSQRFDNNRSGDNLYSDGVSITGGQGASSMSGLGGTIRLGEFRSNEPIRHVIKINPWAAHLFYSAAIPGYRWPATSADQYANSSTHKNQYVGNNPDLVMGSLLAIPPDVTAEDLGLQTEAARKILYTLKYYGAYITEDAGWDVFDFIIQDGVEKEFEDTYGFSMKGELWENEVLKMARALKVIANNGPNSIGGGGTPLQPLACDLGSVGSGQRCGGATPENPQISIQNCPSSPLNVGDRLGLQAIISSGNSSNYSISWSSLNPEVATVDANGSVLAVGAGSTEIEARISNRNIRTTCSISVQARPPGGGDDPENNLISHWKFNRDNRDESGNNHPAILENTSFTSNRVEGEAALLLNGSNAWVNIDHPSLESSFSNRTVSFWVNFDDRRPNSVIYEEGGAYHGMGVRVENSILYTRVKAEGEVAELSMPFTSQVYHHIAVSFDNGEVILYSNGEALRRASLSQSSIPLHSDPAGLGATNGQDVWEHTTRNYMRGKLDDVRIYGNTLTPEDIRELYNEFGSPPDRIDPRILFTKLYFQGMYDLDLGLMKNDWVAKGLLPLEQPFSGEPYNYTGTESLSVIPEATIDWVMVELRDPGDIDRIIWRRAALVDENGNLMETNGELGIELPPLPDQALHLAISHLSSLSVVSATPLDFSEMNASFDFTQNVEQALGTGQQIQIGPVACLFSGDFDSNGLINSQDYNVWRQSGSLLNQYLPVDADGNGIVNVIDFNLWSGNRSKVGVLLR